jgi:diguanylate cyclase (GGDEF)-like protein/PAS domain S-box-containing protein
MNHDALENQLYRYAQDLQELMEQQAKMQQRYRMALQSIGRDVPESDLLSDMLLNAAKMYVVTDALGVVLRISDDLEHAFDVPRSDLCGRFIDQLAAPESVDGFRNVILKFSCVQGLGGIEQRRFALDRLARSSVAEWFEVFAMQVQRSTGLEIFWLIYPAVPAGGSAISIQKTLFKSTGGDCGLVLTDPFGTIHSVTPSFTRVTGYAEADVVGRNPRILGAGRHDNAFFQEFWLALLENGCWNGQLLNRRQNGKSFLAWQSVKMVEDERGNTVSYLAALADLSLRDSASKQSPHLVYHDSLTGLPNRRLFEERLTQAMARARLDDSVLHIVFLDVDGLRNIGSEFGHTEEDRVRLALGDRLKALESSDVRVAQIGEDEFVMLLCAAQSVGEVEASARKAQDVLSQPYSIGNKQRRVSVLLGCVRFPQDGSNLGALLKRANSTMYGPLKHSRVARA